MKNFKKAVIYSVFTVLIFSIVISTGLAFYYHRIAVRQQEEILQLKQSDRLNIAEISKLRYDNKTLTSIKADRDAEIALQKEMQNWNRYTLENAVLTFKHPYDSTSKDFEKLSDVISKTQLPTATPIVYFYQKDAKTIPPAPTREYPKLNETMLVLLKDPNQENMTVDQYLSKSLLHWNKIACGIGNRTTDESGLVGTFDFSYPCDESIKLVAIKGKSSPEIYIFLNIQSTQGIYKILKSFQFLN